MSPRDATNDDISTMNLRRNDSDDAIVAGNVGNTRNNAAVSNGYHHKQQQTENEPAQQRETITNRRSSFSFISFLNKFIVVIAVLIMIIPTSTILFGGGISAVQERHRRLYNTVRALYKLAKTPSEDWNLYYESLDVMAKPALETKQDELLVASWYKVLNLFCDLGELEKMYLPPVVDPSLGLEDNQVLIENKMLLGGASYEWNSTFINKVGDKLPQKYKNRYVVNLNSNEDKIILPLETTTTPNYEVRPMEIVDLGCGKGRIAHEMMSYSEGNAIGLNIDVTQLKNAMQFSLRKDLWPNRLNFKHGSFNDKLPFEDESKDFVYEVGAFTYMINKKSVFQEIFRVLRPGGSFAYQDWTNIGYDATDKEQFEKVMKVKKIAGLIELHDPKELASIAKEVGFDVLFNDDGGYEAKVSSQLLSNMQGSFWFVDGMMDFLINTRIMPAHLIKAWRTMRPSESKTLKETIDREWLNMGHVLLIRKPYE